MGKTVPEYLEEQNITWKVYEDTDNGYHNMLEQFEQYELDIINQGPLAKKGIYRPGLDKFFFDLKNGSLPQVSYFITPIELSEHPPNMPKDGAWIQRKVVQSLMESQYWNSSALIVSYDETGGLAEHVMAPHAPKDTKGEWIKDPYLKSSASSQSALVTVCRSTLSLPGLVGVVCGLSTPRTTARFSSLRSGLLSMARTLRSRS